MKNFLPHTIMIIIVLLVVDPAQAQTIASDRAASLTAEFQFTHLLAQARASRPAGFSLMPRSRALITGAPTFTMTPLAASSPVVGSGSPGRLAKWTGLTSSNSIIGNSTIFEDKFGMVGIGTDTPTSRLTVAGLIESIGSGGGFKFPDGTIQTTSSSGALTLITHDATLKGDGRVAFPLGVAIPLTLSASAGGTIVAVTNLTPGAHGLSASGGNANDGDGGTGVFATGGTSNSGFGGRGLVASGGSSPAAGGVGLRAGGGDSSNGLGGTGLEGFGGESISASGGLGVFGRGGDSASLSAGDGVSAIGGNSAASLAGTGISAFAGTGVLGHALAGDFVGDVDISGMLSKGGGSFKIDHPLDPENRYLYHSFVESPDMKNIYDGNVMTDLNGEATVELPSYFEALNRDFRYQLTVLGVFAQAIIAEKIKGNRFLIRTSAPGVEVSWQVTGIRRDAFANKNRIKIEEEKTGHERGAYLHPEAFDQPEERGVEWARHPEIMKLRKEARERAKQKQR